MKNSNKRLIMETLILTIRAMPKHTLKTAPLHNGNGSIHKATELWRSAWNRGVYLRRCTAACHVTSCWRRVCRAGEVCCALPHTRLHRRSTAAPGRTDRRVSWTCRSEENNHTITITFTLLSDHRSGFHLLERLLLSGYSCCFIMPYFSDFKMK